MHLKINENFLWWTIPELALLSHVVHVHMKVSGVVCIHAGQDSEHKHAIPILRLQKDYFRKIDQIFESSEDLLLV